MKRKWNTPVEVPASDMAGAGVRDVEKRAFLDDVLKRLEQTQRGFAVRYEFSDKKMAVVYRQYTVVAIRKSIGKGSVISKLREDDGLVYVYFARGENWK